MKNTVLIFFSFISFLACSNQGSKSNLNIEGFWTRHSSDFNYFEAIGNYDCPDPEMLALHVPYGLGPHISVQADSISFFRYPYEYYGTFKYEINLDSLVVIDNENFIEKFSIVGKSKDTLELKYKDLRYNSCMLQCEAEYWPFSPDSSIIYKLIQDSISFDPLIDKWWYLIKQFSAEDGSEPLMLAFPEGMPDSIFVTKEMIYNDNGEALISLSLEGEKVDMNFLNPSENTFELTTMAANDSKLFYYLIDYRPYDEIDTLYFQASYSKWKQ